MEQKQSIPIADSLSRGWQIFKGNVGFFILLLITFYGVVIVFSFIVSQLTGGLFALVYIIYLLLAWLMGVGLIKISLKFLDNMKPQIKELFTHTKYLVNFILTELLVGLIVLGGLILLIVPGIIWAIKYSLAVYLVIDKDMKPMDALKKSGELTKGYKWQLFLFGIVIGLVNIAGALALLVGLFVTIPMTMIAYVYVYRKILENAGKSMNTSMPAPTPSVSA